MAERREASSHLSDYTALEWAKDGCSPLTATSSEDIAGHLDGCAECRAKVAAFAAMEQAYDPYGEGRYRDGVRRRGRLVLAALVLLVVAAGLFFLLRP